MIQEKFLLNSLKIQGSVIALLYLLWFLNLSALKQQYNINNIKVIMEVELLEIEKILLLNLYAPNNIAWNRFKAKPNMRDRERQIQNYVGVYFSTLLPQ